MRALYINDGHIDAPHPTQICEENMPSHTSHLSSKHRRWRSEPHKSFAATDPSNKLRLLQIRVKELEEQRKVEMEAYRALIAEMATTCRALQARIRVLEADRSGIEVEARKQKELRRRSWQKSRTHHVAHNGSSRGRRAMAAGAARRSRKKTASTIIDVLECRGRACFGERG